MRCCCDICEGKIPKFSKWGCMDLWIDGWMDGMHTQIYVWILEDTMDIDLIWKAWMDACMHG